jgi:urease beta subunit
MIHSKKRKAGISDVLATVIIVAATVAIALVAVAYFTGLVGGSTQTQRVVISPVSRICVVNGTEDNYTVKLYLKIENMGSKTIQITSLQVGNQFIDLDNPITVEAGKAVNESINITNKTTVPYGTFQPGSTYDLQLYTSGNVQVLSTEVQAFSGDCPS